MKYTGPSAVLKVGSGNINENKQQHEEHFIHCQGTISSMFSRNHRWGYTGCFKLGNIIMFVIIRILITSISIDHSFIPNIPAI